MALETYEGLEVASRLLQDAADKLKDDGKISKSEALEMAVKFLTDLGGEVIDDEEKGGDS